MEVSFLSTSKGNLTYLDIIDLFLITPHKKEEQ